MATLTVIGNGFAPRTPSTLTIGSVNADPVVFVLDGSWDGLTVFAAFRNDAEGVERHVLLGDDLTCTIPWECLTQAGTLNVGLLGLRGSDVVKPTIWMQFGRVVQGVNSEGEAPGEPTETALQQVVAIAQSVRDDADQGRFNGKPGEDGKSPYVGENGHWFEWQDGEYVDTGKVAEGRNGEDGVSPTVEVTQTGTGHKVVITDKDGEKSFDVNNGQNGEDGEDGVSPTIAVEDVDGGHKVIITGKDGPKEFVVLNGKNGDPGDPGENGQTPSITIGTVETLPADSPATAEIVGQTPNLTMNLGIPQGPKGATGLGVPPPTQEDAGRAVVVNKEGDGYTFADGVLLQEISGENYGSVIYNFPEDYDTFWVVGTLDVAADSNTVVFYQYVRSQDVNSSLKFWDYYGQGGKRISVSLCYKRVRIGGTSLLKVEGLIANGDYIPGNKITPVESSWGDKDSAGMPLIRFMSISISGTFSSVNLKIYGR